jgi:DNA-binding NtrC family response regulator
MPDLVRYVAERLTNQQEGDALAEEATKWILENLGRDYAWPGNFRELEQCIRNILVRKAYAPAHAPAQGAVRGEEEAFLEAVGAGRLSADELLQGYCNLVHRQCGTCQETARRLGLDHRTVKARLREK